MLPFTLPKTIHRGLRVSYSRLLTSKGPVNKLAMKTEAGEEDADAGIDTVSLAEGKLDAWQALPGAGEMKSCIGLGQFRSLSSDCEAQLFCEGLTKELFNTMRGMMRLQISKIPPIDQQRMTPAAMCRKLNVNAVLLGKVRKIGERLRISIRLTSGSDGSVMWSGMYERRFENAPAIQGEIARAIVHAAPI
jgi:TolB-like protein